MPGIFSLSETVRFTLPVFKMSLPAAFSGDITYTLFGLPPASLAITDLRVSLQIDGTSKFAAQAVNLDGTITGQTGILVKVSGGIVTVLADTTYTGAVGNGAGRYVVRVYSNTYSSASYPSTDWADVGTNVSVGALDATTAKTAVTAGTIYTNAATAATQATTAATQATTAATQATTAASQATTAATQATNAASSAAAVNTQVQTGGYIYTQLHTGGAVYDGATAATAANTELQTGGYVYTQLHTGGNVYDGATAATTANTELQTGGYVYTQLHTGGNVYDGATRSNSQLQAGGDVYDNAASAATDAAAAALAAGNAETAANNAEVQATIAATAVTAGGTVYDQLQPGGDVYDNAAAAATDAAAAAVAATNAETAATNAETAATNAETQATIAATALTAGGTVYDELQPGGDVYDNVAAAAANTTSQIPVPDLIPSILTPSLTPSMSDQVALLYLLLSGLPRTFDPATGRIYLDLSPMYVPAGPVPPGKVAFYQCWADPARTIPPTTLAAVVAQDPLTVV